MALNEGNLPEVFQTGTRRGQWLPRALRPHSRLLSTQIQCQRNHHTNPFLLVGMLTTHHNKGVSQPKGAPTSRAIRHLAGLTVKGHHVGLGLAHRAPAPGGTKVTGTKKQICLCTCVRECPLPADVALESSPRDERHVAGQKLVSGEPIGVVISGGIAAGAIGAAEEEGHGGKTR